MILIPIQNSFRRDLKIPTILADAQNLAITQLKPRKPIKINPSTILQSDWTDKTKYLPLVATYCNELYWKFEI